MVQPRKDWQTHLARIYLRNGSASPRGAQQRPTNTVDVVLERRDGGHTVSWGWCRDAGAGLLGRRRRATHQMRAIDEKHCGQELFTIQSALVSAITSLPFVIK